MIDWEKVGLKILLVGEGNFSFSLAFLSKISRSHEINVWSSCYQKYSELSKETRQNARLVNCLGAEVWFGLDATKLHCHERISQLKFDYIIFNFPHVGGKMKIHLNRALLKSFFISAGLQLAEGGEILVTLAQGQGGTCYDSLQRKFEDTWQITLMATFADLILKQVTPLRREDWPEYYCNGYRSLEKGFHLHGAMTHAFTVAPLNLSSQADITLCSWSSFHCPYIQKRLVDLKGDAKCFLEVPLFQKYLLSKGKNFQIVHSVEIICLCLSVENLQIWRSCPSHSNFTIYSLLICRPCFNRDQFDPVQRVISIQLPLSEKLEMFTGFLNTRCRIRRTSNPSLVEYLDESNNLTIAAVIQLNNSQIIEVFLDEFIKLTSNFPHGLGEFPTELQYPVKSLYPPVYSHDLSFWIPPNFCHRKFACVVHQISGNVIKSFKLIDEFRCELTQRQSVCYRLVYQSTDKALSPDGARHLHMNVIRRWVEKCLGVSVR